MLKKQNIQRMNQCSPQFNPQISNFPCKTKLFHEPIYADDKFHSDQNSSLLLSSIKSKSHITSQCSNKKIKLKLHFKTEAWNTPEKKKTQKQKTAKKISLVQRKPLMEKNINSPELSPKRSPKLSKLPKIYETEWCRKNETSTSKQNFIDSQVECLPFPRKSSLSYSATNTNKPTSQDCTSVKSKTIHFSVNENKSMSISSKLRQTKNEDSRSSNKNKQIIRKISHFLYPHQSKIKIDLFDSTNKRQNSKLRSRSKSIKSKEKETVFHENTEKISKLPQDNQEKYHPNQSIKRALQKISSYKFVQEYMQELQVQSHLRGFQGRSQPQCKWPLLLVDQVFKKIRSGGTFESIVAKS